MQKIHAKVHQISVFNRRVNVLCRHLGRLLSDSKKVLDVGCGNGLIAARLVEQNPELKIAGVDVLVRPETHIPVEEYNGSVLPYEDNTFDCVMFVDVLHHTESPDQLLKEAQRVSKKHIVIKDHLLNGLLAFETLRFMDWFGNAQHDVNLPYNYWSKVKWQQTFDELGMHVQEWESDLNLYPMPFSLLFDRSMHFCAQLSI